ncbi:MAG TPA: YqhA family protein [Methylomirabilota bacterium]|jgi:uncharacterized membrane protein YqhA
MLIKVLQLRYVLAVAVVFTLINSVLCLAVGIRQSLDGYRVIFRFLGGEEIAGPKVLLLESLDSFLAGLVFLIFGLGIVKIFIVHGHDIEGLPAWLQIHSFVELKILLWETILVALVVMTVGTVARRLHALSWDVLVLPGVVLIMAVGLYLMRSGEE